MVEGLPFHLFLERGVCPILHLKALFHFSWLENHLINVLNMLENAFLCSCDPFAQLHLMHQNTSMIFRVRTECTHNPVIF